MTSKQQRSPFQLVVDDLTGGCGCACHTGIGYRTSCEHCYRAPTENELLATVRRLVAESFERSSDETIRLLREALGV